MFAITVEAFNLAEYYQTPVIVLSDQEIAQRKETVERIDTSKFHLVERRRPTETELAQYARFKLTESGISPVSHPGMPGGNYLAAGIEHNEVGRPTASLEMHAWMNEKRFRKFNPLKDRRDLFVIEGDPEAPIALVSWGSVAGVAREALRLAQAEGLHAKLLVPKLLYPVAEQVYQDFFASVKRGLFIEQSFQAQLYRLVRMYVDFPASIKHFAKSGSNPIQPAEVLGRLREMAMAIQGNGHHHQSEPIAD
jgi:2-oxoglutarate ferredoxin oxidoreductase subunit alpha